MGLSRTGMFGLVLQGPKDNASMDLSESEGQPWGGLLGQWTMPLHDIGKRVILSLPFIGGQCHMAQCYHDAMAVAHYFGKIDYFIMMTANPKWCEIQENLLPGQSTTDHPDLMSRAFCTKQQQLLDDITKSGIFGQCVVYVCTVEFQMGPSTCASLGHPG